jgi:hypothetical protein
MRRLEGNLGAVYDSAILENVTYEKFEKGIEVNYKRKGIFMFKGIEFNMREAISLADIIIKIITDEDCVLTNKISVEGLVDTEKLISKIDEQFPQDIPFICK